MPFNVFRISQSVIKEQKIKVSNLVNLAPIDDAKFAIEVACYALEGVTEYLIVNAETGSVEHYVPITKKDDDEK